MTEARLAISVSAIVTSQLFSSRFAADNFARVRPCSVDAAVSALFLAAGELQVSLDPGIHDRWIAGASVVVLAGATGLRRRAPTAGLVTAIAAVSVEAGFGGALTRVAISIPSSCLLFYAAGSYQVLRQAKRALLVGVGLLLVQVVSTPHVISDLFFEPVLIAFGPWLGGVLVRERGIREHAIRNQLRLLETQADLRSREATERERARIAREIHDAVGHFLSVIVLQAGGARLHLDTSPDRVATALDIIERCTNQALGELRHLLTECTSENLARRRPQPTLSDVADLIEAAQSSGLEARLEVEGTPRPLPVSAGLCAYRIIQEALTNTIKHSGGRGTTVRLRWCDSDLTIEVSDDGRHGRDDELPTGHGLIGMRERVAMLDGELATGVCDAGGFRVTARLPVPVGGVT